MLNVSVVCDSITEKIYCTPGAETKYFELNFFRPMKYNSNN